MAHSGNGSDFSHSGHVARPWEEPGYPDAGYEPRSLKEHLGQALDVLQRRKWIVLCTCVLVVVGISANTYMQETVHRAQSLVMITEERALTGHSEQDETTDLFARSDRSLNNELLILRNSRALPRGVAERLIEKQNLPASDRPIPMLTASDSTQRDVEAVASQVRRAVQFSSASRDGKVIEITARSRDPAEATLLADFYAEEYLKLTQQASRAHITASREFLERQADRYSSDLESIERDIQHFQMEHGSVTLDREGSALVSRMASAEVERDEAQLALRMREANMESLEDQLASISPESLSQRVGSGLEMEIEVLQSKIAELELYKKELELVHSPFTAEDSVHIAQVERQIKHVRDDVAQLSRQYVNEVMEAGGIGASEGIRRVEQLQRQIAEGRIEITGLETRIAVLSDRLEEYEAELRTIPVQSMQLAQLQRDRAYAEEMYQFVMRQLQETRFQEESHLGYANRITEEAVLLRPIGPELRRNVIRGVLLGLILGVGIAFVRDRLDHRIYKPEEIRDKGYSVLGVIPNLKPVIDDYFQGEDTIEIGDCTLSTRLVAEVYSMSAAGEAYRRLRTTILFSRYDRVMETILVTSPGMGDGKSVSAANLAIVMAQSGRRTLLLDADMHRPSAHLFFDALQSPGLTDALRDGAFRNPLHIQPTAIDNLYLLSAGQAVTRSGDLLGSEELRDLFSRLKEHFDVIVVDTPPVLASADAELFSTQCDATVVVARAGVTTDAEFHHTMQSLADVGAHVIGSVFNGFDLSMAYGYKLRFRHYTRYGPYGEYSERAHPRVMI